jgi:methyl-accepting chemotaxis protein
MEEVKRELQNAKGRMNDKADRLRDEEKLSENTLKDLEASSAHMQEAQSMMKELTERMKESAFARQTPELQQIAESMVQPAEEQTRNIPLTDRKEARSEMAKNTRALLEKAIEKLDGEQRQMDEDREKVQQAAQLSDIAEQQQRLIPVRQF